MYRVLVVDDDTEILKKIKGILLKEFELSIQFSFVHSDISAQNIVHQSKFELVITESCSSGVDGYSLMRFIKDEGDTKVIALIGKEKSFEDISYMTDVALSIGAISVISKSELDEKLAKATRALFKSSV